MTVWSKVIYSYTLARWDIVLTYDLVTKLDIKMHPMEHLGFVWHVDGDAFSSWHLVRSNLGLIHFVNFGISLFKFFVFSELWNLNIPRYMYMYLSLLHELKIKETRSARTWIYANLVTFMVTDELDTFSFHISSLSSVATFRPLLLTAFLLRKSYGRTKHFKYTLNKSSKWYIVYICRVFRKGLNADKSYHYFDFLWKIKIHNVIFVHFEFSCQYQFTSKTMTPKAKWRLKPK